MKAPEIFNLVDLEPHIGIRVDWSPCGAPEVNYLAIVFFDSVKLYPGDVVFGCVWMRHSVTHHDTNNILPLLVSFIYGNGWNMLLFAFILRRFNNLWKVHLFLLLQVEDPIPQLFSKALPLSAAATGCIFLQGGKTIKVV